MSDAETASEPPADPLGRRRCPKCLYDRYGLAEVCPCPECGFTRPRTVTVLTMRRKRESTVLVVLPFAALALVAFLSIGLNGRGVYTLLSNIATFMPGVAGFLVYRLRHAWTDDAAYVQLWVTREAIGLERCADRRSPLRPIAGVATALLAYGGMAAVFFNLSLQAGIAAFFWIPLTLVSSALVAIWLTRVRSSIPPIDPNAPRMLRRDRAYFGAVSADVRTNLIVRPLGFWTWPTSIEIVGDAAVAAEINKIVSPDGDGTACRQAM